MTREGLKARLGGCLCGAVRFRATGEPLWVSYCHCSDCRRATGAPVSVFVGLREADFRITEGRPAGYASSPGVQRGYCSRCGTPLTYQADFFPGEVHVLIGTFDRPESFAPTDHVWTAEALPWLRIADDLPRKERVALKKRRR